MFQSIFKSLVPYTSFLGSLTHIIQKQLKPYGSILKICIIAPNNFTGNDVNDKYLLPIKEHTASSPHFIFSILFLI